ncbi:hypothetical protein PGT21_010287 [Puccinia graminis f. sp. tritici]|uniref:Uncharacterized protein n=1 Tax=Puccinia graminis f. sp. tritici TaxID=56615 RepID=A0A5B0NAN0_PUCGR|nr:hypothetical protein PGT21_010287 [Puccinia graminis f. sp. tritici]KAA1135948.1 hypothetical protein PGTUg99_007774 [Puccinia graminis f. sp. tritici]
MQYSNTAALQAVCLKRPVIKHKNRSATQTSNQDGKGLESRWQVIFCKPWALAQGGFNNPIGHGFNTRGDRGNSEADSIHQKGETGHSEFRTLAASPSFGGSLREVPVARWGPPSPQKRGDCVKLVQFGTLARKYTLQIQATLSQATPMWLTGGRNCSLTIALSQNLLGFSSTNADALTGDPFALQCIQTNLSPDLPMTPTHT